VKKKYLFSLFLFKYLIAIILLDYLLIFMIENYKGWDIILNWDDNKSLKTKFYNQKEKWEGVNLDGNRIYGSSLKEIRHIIDYPGLHK